MWNIDTARRKWIACGAAALLFIAVFVPALSVGYFADDFDFLVRMRSGYPLADVIVKNTDGTVGGGSWRPITMASFWLSMRAAQSGVADHVVSLGLYAVLCVLFALTLRRIIPEARTWIWIGWTLVFALLPIHAEPVLWVGARADLLAAVFALGALLAWMLGARAWAIVLYAASLLSKEVWILLPAVFIMLPESTEERKKRRTILFIGAAAAVALLFFIIRYVITTYTISGYSTAAQIDVVRYIKELLAFVVGWPLFGDAQARAVQHAMRWWPGYSLVAAVLVIAVARTLEQRVRWLFVGLIGTLVPIALLRVPFIHVTASVGEQRYWLAPSVFVVLIVAWYAQRLLYESRARIVIILITGAAVITAAAGMRHNIALFRHAALQRDALLIGWNQLGAHANTYTPVALPDTYHGVHLAASPFFERMTQWYGLARPQTPQPWYQVCDMRCAEPLRISARGEDLVLTAAHARLTRVHERGLHTTVKLPIETASQIAVWTGERWLVISGFHVENTGAAPNR